MSCNTLTRCIPAAKCPTEAGINGRVWVGFTDDIDTAVLTFGTDGQVTAFGLKTGKKLRKFTTRRYKNTASHEIVKGDNGIVTFNHIVSLQHYIETQADIAALQQLAKAQDLFFVVQLNSGKIKVFGLSTTSPAGFGLSSRGEGGQNEGTNIGDDNSDKLTFDGIIPNKPMFYKPTATLSANITELDGLTQCP